MEVRMLKSIGFVFILLTISSSVLARPRDCALQKAQAKCCSQHGKDFDHFIIRIGCHGFAECKGALTVEFGDPSIARLLKAEAMENDGAVSVSIDDVEQEVVLDRVNEEEQINSSTFELK
jgi:hypothetical protein